jgi:nitronate monooxygenase
VSSGLDPDHLPETVPGRRGFRGAAVENIWSAGQGVGSVDSVETGASLCDHLEVEYGAAMESLCRSLRKDADADRTR